MSTSTNWPPTKLRINAKWLAALIVLGGTSVAALLAFGDTEQTVALIQRANWWYLLGALSIHYSGFAVRGWRWQMLLKAMGHALPYGYCTRLLISGWFVSAIIPARAGDILRIGILRAPAINATELPAVPVADATSSVLLERVLDMVAILLLGATFGFIMLRGELPSWVLTLYGTIILILGVLGLALIALPRLWNLLGTLWQHSLWQKLISFGAETTKKLAVLVRQPGTALAVIGLSLYIWLCDAFLLWFVMRSLGELLGFGSAAFVALTVDVIAAVPITPGGLGQIEGAYAALLGLMSLPSTKLPATILLTRAISYWTFLLFSGLVTILAFWLPSRKPAGSQESGESLTANH